MARLLQTQQIKTFHSELVFRICLTVHMFILMVGSRGEVSSQIYIYCNLRSSWTHRERQASALPWNTSPHTDTHRLLETSCITEPLPSQSHHPFLHSPPSIPPSLSLSCSPLYQSSSSPESAMVLPMYVRATFRSTNCSLYDHIKGITFSSRSPRPPICRLA